jgi:hypothetical protein
MEEESLVALLRRKPMTEHVQILNLHATSTVLHYGKAVVTFSDGAICECPYNNANLSCSCNQGGCKHIQITWSMKRVLYPGPTRAWLSESQNQARREADVEHARWRDATDREERADKKHESRDGCCPITLDYQATNTNTVSGKCFTSTPRDPSTQEESPQIPFRTTHGTVITPLPKFIEPPGNSNLRGTQADYVLYEPPRSSDLAAMSDA